MPVGMLNEVNPVHDHMLGAWLQALLLTSLTTPDMAFF